MFFRCAEGIAATIGQMAVGDGHRLHIMPPVNTGGICLRLYFVSKFNPLDPNTVQLRLKLFFLNVDVRTRLLSALFISH